ncbi:hypothetical protein STEG23_004477, partial [Scotinomys teguina]
MCLGEERLWDKIHLKNVGDGKCKKEKKRKEKKIMKSVICASEGKFAYGVCLKVELKKLVGLMTDLEKMFLGFDCQTLKKYYQSNKNQSFVGRMNGNIQ